MMRVPLLLIMVLLLNTSYTSANPLEGRGYARDQIKHAEACGAAAYNYVEDLRGLSDDDTYLAFLRNYLNWLLKNYNLALDFDQEFENLTGRQTQNGVEGSILYPLYAEYKCTGFDKTALSFMSATYIFEKHCFSEMYGGILDVPKNWNISFNSVC